MRQVVLDTETTGIKVEDGHRVIEIGCVELIDRKLTGNHFHRYINPEREIDAGAFAVHGISTEFLKDKPRFTAVVDEFMSFVSDSELVIHNAPFDLGFLNNELKLCGPIWKMLTDYCSVIDTLRLARQLHVGQRNSLDALCKRYFIDNSKRDLHGALLDANLLARVYLAMTGGQGSIFDSLEENESSAAHHDETSVPMSVQKHNLVVIAADDSELAEHQAYLDMLKKQGKCVWE